MLQFRVLKRDEHGGNEVLLGWGKTVGGLTDVGGK